MTDARFQEITGRYPALRIAVVGDFSLDRYLEIDPAKAENSIETGRPVHNITATRAQPGAAGTVLANLSALSIGELWPVGFCGCDGEGFELQHALQALPGVRMDYFFASETQRTFTYCKPLVMEPNQPPRELNRLDTKNWHPTPDALQKKLTDAVGALAGKVDAMIILDQVDEPETGVATKRVLQAIHTAFGNAPSGTQKISGEECATYPAIIGDSRHRVQDLPCTHFKMNRAELESLTGKSFISLEEIESTAEGMALEEFANYYVTLAEDGIIAANLAANTYHAPALPLRGDIDIVGAGDAVTANLAAAVAAGAEPSEAISLANRAASIVIHQLGTTGTASVEELRDW